MFKLLRKLICLAIIAAIAFVVISLYYGGGEKFRWFGAKVEKESEKIGEKADELNEKKTDIMKGIVKTKEKTKETIKDLTGKKDDKSH